MRIDLKDLLHFERFITPIYVKIIYWIVCAIILAAAAISAIVAISEAFSYYGGGAASALAGVLIAFFGGAFGLLFWRIACEMVMLLFTMGENLRKLRAYADQAMGGGDEPSQAFKAPAAAEAPAAPASTPAVLAPKPSPTL